MGSPHEDQLPFEVESEVVVLMLPLGVIVGGVKFVMTRGVHKLGRVRESLRFAGGSNKCTPRAPPCGPFAGAKASGT